MPWRATVPHGAAGKFLGVAAFILIVCASSFLMQSVDSTTGSFFVQQEDSFNVSQQQARGVRAWSTCRAPQEHDSLAPLLSWLVGTEGGGPVAVVDLGDGPRWLRPLHARARAPLLLWRASIHPRRGSAPQWLERCHAYLLAALSARRVATFLINDTNDMVEPACGPYPHNEMFRPRRRLQLNSRARTLAALLEDDTPHPKKAILEKVRSKEFYKMAEHLHGFHQNYGAVLLRERGVRSKGCLRMAGPPEVFVRTALPCAGKACGIRAAVNEARRRGRTAMLTNLVSPMDRHKKNTKPYLELRDFVQTPYRTVLEETEKMYKIMWIVDWKMKQKGNDWVTYYEQWSEADVAKALEDASIEFSPLVFTTNPRASKGFDAIPGSADRERIRMLVPRASQKAAWSLPLRVFGLVIWLALGGTAAAYALAWRAVAGASLAEGAAAALRAFSSCVAPGQGRVRPTAQRLQLAGALLASSVVLVTLYQASLFKLMTEPQMNPEINTFEQLWQSGLPVVSRSEKMMWMFEHPDPSAFSAKDFATRMQATTLRHRVIGFEELNYRLRMGQQFAQIECASLWQMKKRAAHWERFRVMRETVEENMKFMHSRRNWPWKISLDHFLHILNSAGLWTFWREDFKRKSKNMNMSVANAELQWVKDFWFESRRQPEGPLSFALADLLPHFQLLGAGLALAALALAVEIWRG